MRETQLFSTVNFGYGENPKSERLRLITKEYDFELAIDKGQKDQNGKLSFTEMGSVTLNLEKIAILKINFIDQYLKLKRNKMYEIRKEAKPTTLHDVFFSCPGDTNYKLYVLRFITHVGFDQNQKAQVTTKFMIYGLINGWDDYSNIRKSKEFPRDAVIADFTLNDFSAADGDQYVPKSTIIMEQLSSILEAIMSGTSSQYAFYLQELAKEKSENSTSSSIKNVPDYVEKGTHTDAEIEDEFPF